MNGADGEAMPLDEMAKVTGAEFEEIRRAG